MRRFGGAVDFGRAAADYGRHRAGFPPIFFDRLAGQIAMQPGQRALDIGTGTGSVARGLALRGLTLTGLDPSEALLSEARALDGAAKLEVDYVVGTAEALPFADGAFDIVTAGQCWHWFDRERAAREASRVLRPGGLVVLAHFDWLPLPGTVVEATEALILAHNPAWPGAGGGGVYPQWLTDLAGAGFSEIETASFDIDQPYSHEGWRGRIKASAGIKASLGADATAAFDSAHAAMLAERFPREPLLAPHRVWWTIGRKPVPSAPQG
ncbi:class I SAM-dependent methyltransferase [Sphingobium sp. B12D2B]|uniref:class I SAM-dependent methyltransferase n=1 Tax=Sphingobium sp. B12D2B TaxID=2940577 RepID=UPI0022251B11|nr:class I SAM-dependent methyltransferase [Sphingobium sp. B12D2B]MCW2348634.1 SAM-dependent methyltransferase [Sphingobium sp. B12D2B]